MRHAEPGARQTHVRETRSHSRSLAPCGGRACTPPSSRRRVREGRAIPYVAARIPPRGISGCPLQSHSGVARCQAALARPAAKWLRSPSGLNSLWEPSALPLQPFWRSRHRSARITARKKTCGNSSQTCPLDCDRGRRTARDPLADDGQRRELRVSPAECGVGPPRPLPLYRFAWFQRIWASTPASPTFPVRDGWPSFTRPLPPPGSCPRSGMAAAALRRGNGVGQALWDIADWHENRCRSGHRSLPGTWAAHNSRPLSCGNTGPDRKAGPQKVTPHATWHRGHLGTGRPNKEPHRGRPVAAPVR